MSVTADEKEAVVVRMLVGGPLPPPPIGKRAHFSSDLIMASHVAPTYDRTAAENDIFSCDICGLQIPAGIKGFEPYGTCEICVHGFDVCGACCGSEALLRLCHATPFSPTKIRPTLRVKCHEHALKVIDRRAEILWANGVTFDSIPPNSPGSRQSPRKRLGNVHRSPPGTNNYSPRKRTKA